MAFVEIDASTPAGTEKKKFGDDRIRELKEQTVANLEEITNYPASTKPALKTAVWTTATRPSGDELVDRVTGYNTDLGCDEFFDLASTSWKQKRALPAWTVSGRPSSPYTGQYGYNSDLAVVERWSGSAWTRISGGRRGDIKIWSGALNNIEPGWVLADGVTRTHPEGGTYAPPNLIDRFITGAGSSYAVGATGGANTVVLSTNEMPYHSHYMFSNEQPSAVSNSDIGAGWVAKQAKAGIYENYAMKASGWGPEVGLVSYNGASWGHENRPPFYALCYLYKI